MNVDDETLNQLRKLDAASFTTLTDEQRARARSGKASILATELDQSEQAVPSARQRKGRARTRSRLAWSIGLVAVTGAAVAALVFAATTYLGAPAPVIGTTPDATSTPTPSPLQASEQPQLTEAEAIAGCVEAWRPDPSVQSPERYNSTYVNDKAITNVVDGEWQVTLVPTQRIEAEWNLYCNSFGELVTTFTNGYEVWPTLPPLLAKTTGDTVLLTPEHAPTRPMYNRVIGTLELSDTGCWYLVDGQSRALLQFPFGSVLSDDGQSVDVPGLGAVRAGVTIDGTGEVGSAPSDTPESCGGPAQPMAFWHVP
ncbi:MAG: hypothetical protein ACTIA6_16100 [Pseudoclavibacter sp.]